MNECERWIQIVERDGLLLLTAEGPYVRYGMPVYVTIRRHGSFYRVEWTEDGDGVGVPASGNATFDRSGLEQYLQRLLADGRPVHRIGR